MDNGHPVIFNKNLSITLIFGKERVFDGRSVEIIEKRFNLLDKHYHLQVAQVHAARGSTINLIDKSHVWTKNGNAEFITHELAASLILHLLDRFGFIHMQITNED